MLVLANVWDCASARIIEQAGFPAVATTSAGIAFSLGYADGQFISPSEMLSVARRIAGSVQVPVTADVEAGYQDAAATAAAVIDDGIVGVNLEDIEGETPVDIQTQVKRVQAMRKIGEEKGVPLVINARTDIYLAQIGDPATRFERSCERLQAYREAGADCLFIPGVTDENLIRRFVETLRFPINILATPGCPSIPRLKELGVARVSVGSGIARTTLGLVNRAAEELKTKGTYENFHQGAVPYPEMQALFRRD